VNVTNIFNEQQRGVGATNLCIHVLQQKEVVLYIYNNHVDNLQVFFQWWAPLVHHLPSQKHITFLEQITTLPSIQMLATPY
jgi:hypothetical protein